MYDPTSGRWTTKDPSAISAGDADLYRFVGNDPTNETDPSGKDGIWDWIFGKPSVLPNDPIAGYAGAGAAMSSGTPRYPKLVKLELQGAGKLEISQPFSIKRIHIDDIKITGKDAPPGGADLAKKYVNGKSMDDLIDAVKTLKSLAELAGKPTDSADLALAYLRGQKDYVTSVFPEGFIPDGPNQQSYPKKDWAGEKDIEYLIELKNFQVESPISGLDVQIEITGSITVSAKSVEYIPAKKME